MKSLTWLTRIGLLLIVLTVATPCQAWQLEISSRVQSPPEVPNTLMHLKVGELRKIIGGSELTGEIASHMTTVDVAAEMDFDTWHPNWEFGEVRMNEVPRLQDVAEAGKGYIDTIGTTEVVWLPREEYVLPAGKDGVIVVRPADRQRLSRWLSSGSRASNPGYLLAAAKSADADAALWIAFDVEGLLSPARIHERLMTVDALKNNEAAMQKLAALFGTLKGVQITILSGDQPQAKLALDFGTPPTALEIAGKSLMEEAMRRRDVLLPNWDKWGSSVEGNSLVFTGPVAVETVDNLLSLFTIHNEAKAMKNSVDNKKKAGDDAEDLAAMATKQYFDSVNSIIKRVDSYSAGSSGARAHWNDKMAGQIDELPTLNVDPACVQFGVDVGNLLRGSGNVMRQANIQAGSEKATAAASGASTDNVSFRGGYAAGYGYYGGGAVGGYQYNNYYDTGRQLQYNRAIDAQARAKGYSNYRESMTEIKQKSGEMRRQMTEKYKIQF